jgi:helicase
VIRLPPSLDLPAAETAAFAQLRGLKGHSRSWADLAAHAQLVMTYYQDLPHEQTATLHDIHAAQPLVAASRILDALSKPDIGLPKDERSDWALLAMIAFGMWGNFLSASAAKANLSSDALSRPITAAIIATCTPQLAHDYQTAASASASAADYMRALLLFLRSGHSKDSEELEHKLMACLPEADAFESAMLRSTRIVLRQVIILAAISSIEQLLPTLSKNYSRRLFDDGIRVLLPPQYRAIVSAQLPQSSSNSLVALHTSAGKTLLGELCLMSALDQGPGLAVFMAPYVALGRQIADRLKKHAPLSVRIHTLVGGFRSEDSLDPTLFRELVVATPERFDAIVRNNPELLNALSCVVVDEAHLIGSGIRGARLEGFLTRLRMQQLRGSTIRIVLLSAVTHSYARLQKWLDIPDTSVITDSWRPTARRLAIWDRDGQIRWYRGQEIMRPDNASNMDVLGSRLVPWPRTSFYPAKHFGSIQQQQPDAIENAAALAEYLWKEFHDVCLCVCMTKDTTRKLAWQLSKRLALIETLPDNLAKTVALIKNEFPHLHLLSTCLRHGVAYHNASLPHEVRRGIEDAAMEREIRVVTATTTLAEGVDLPFRSTVLVDWLTWQGDRSGPMSPLLFRNISGRCGRAGRQTEGDTVIFDNPVGDPAFTFNPDRTNLQRQTFFGDMSGELQSVMEEAKPNTPFAEDVEAAIASQFLAAIPENPQQDDLVGAFTDAMYWPTGSNQASRAKSTVQSVAASILDSTRNALAVAASPFRLTDFGQASLRSGFSPESCRAIITYFTETGAPENNYSLIAHMLVSLGWLSEQPDRTWRKEIEKAGRGCRVKVGDTEAVVTAWLGGESLLAIFLALPSVQKSKSKVKVVDWLKGLDEPAVWDEEFEGFVDWLNSVIVSFGSWLMRSCAGLSSQVEGWPTEINWPSLSDYCEFGIDNDWALAAIRRGAPASREILSKLGKSVFAQFVTADDPLGMASYKETISDPTEDQNIQLLIRRLFADSNPHLESANRVVDWMRSG